jgi:squalene-hopene/tetraprenyl-beta-curcumene cyclase
MKLRLALVFALLPTGAPPVRADEPTTAQMQKAAARGIAFLEADALKWRKERKCATCHHGAMTVWALAEARSRGYAVKDETFADVVKWTKEKLKDVDKPRDTRPGWSVVNSPALYLSVMAQAVPEQDALTADELKRIGGHLVRHQETDGGWAWSAAPAENRPPPFFESDELATLLADVALAPQVPADPKEKSEVRDAREKGLAWLAKEKPTGTTQALAIRLFRAAQAGKPAKELRPQIDALLKRQNKDGGWGQVPDAPGDAFATGQALYFLNIAGVAPDTAEMRRGLSFLVTTQKDDGSWPMTRRGHPGVTPSNFTWPIVHLGSAWATIALAHCAPK